MTYFDFKQHNAVSLQSAASRWYNGWFEKANSYGYSYHFECLGRPLIQYPQDIVQYQECCHEARPDLIIETGIAHGGSLILSASMLCLLDVMEGIDPRQSKRKVVGIDIDIRSHNLEALSISLDK